MSTVLYLLQWWPICNMHLRIYASRAIAVHYAMINEKYFTAKNYLLPIAGFSSSLCWAWHQNRGRNSQLQSDLRDISLLRHLNPHLSLVETLGCKINWVFIWQIRQNFKDSWQLNYPIKKMYVYLLVRAFITLSLEFLSSGIPRYNILSNLMKKKSKSRYTSSWHINMSPKKSKAC